MRLDDIRTALKDRRVDAVSLATGLSRSAITRIRDGQSLNPTYYTLRKLTEYLQGPIDRIPVQDGRE